MSPTISTAGSLEPQGSKTAVAEAPRSAAGRPEWCDEHTALIGAKLATGLTAQRIHKDFVAEVGFAGSYQSVKCYVRRLRQA